LLFSSIGLLDGAMLPLVEDGNLEVIFIGLRADFGDPPFALCSLRAFNPTPKGPLLIICEFEYRKDQSREVE